MLQYIINVPDTSDAKALLRIIIATGYFNQVKKVNTNTNEKIPNKETIEAIDDARNNRTTEVKITDINNIAAAILND